MAAQATPIKALIERCRFDAAALGLADLAQQATRAEAEYDALLSRNAEFERECRTKTTAGATLVAEERLRQIEVEGYTLEQDRTSILSGDLAQAGAAYATHAVMQLRGHALPAGCLWGRALWPWGWEVWNPKDDLLRNLVRGAALIVAEIDRMLENKRKAHD